MKIINLVYPDFLNAGDVFSPQIVGLLSGLPVVRSKARNADMLALGGALFTIQYSPDFKKRCLQKALVRLGQRLFLPHQHPPLLPGQSHRLRPAGPEDPAEAL